MIVVVTGFSGGPLTTVSIVVHRRHVTEPGFTRTRPGVRGLPARFTVYRTVLPDVVTFTPRDGVFGSRRPANAGYDVRQAASPMQGQHK